MTSRQERPRLNSEAAIDMITGCSNTWTHIGNNNDLITGYSVAYQRWKHMFDVSGERRFHIKNPISIHRFIIHKELLGQVCLEAFHPNRNKLRVRNVFFIRFRSLSGCVILSIYSLKWVMSEREWSQVDLSEGWDCRCTGEEEVCLLRTLFTTTLIYQVFIPMSHPDTISRRM